MDPIPLEALRCRTEWGGIIIHVVRRFYCLSNAVKMLRREFWVTH